MSKIEWTDATWNPITGCTKVSAGCKNCYAERMSKRLRGRYGYPSDDPFRVTFHPDRLERPLRWRKPRRVFVCSMSDLFHDDVKDEWLIQVFDVLRRCHNEREHTFQILTKRPRRMADFCRRLRFSGSANDGKGRMWLSPVAALHDGGWGLMGGSPGSHPLGSVWLGTSVEDQATADERIPHLLNCPAAVRFVSYEPALGPVDFADPGYHWLKGIEALGAHEDGSIEWDHDAAHLDWVIAGGESGPGHRPADPEWFRSVRDQCSAANVAFFMKQMAGKTPIPEDLVCREWPS
jgi:protein gp37